MPILLVSRYVPNLAYLLYSLYLMYLQTIYLTCKFRTLKDLLGIDVLNIDCLCV